MMWDEQGGISEVFWTSDRQFAFQRAGNYWNLYGADGEFMKDFRSFVALQGFITQERLKKERAEKHEG